MYSKSGAQQVRLCPRGSAIMEDGGWAIWNRMSCRKATGEGRKSGETMDGGRLSLAGWVYDIETPQALLLVSIQIWKGHCYLGGGSS
jgi:hypothetical protein